MRRRRERLGLRQCDIARFIGVTHSAVAFWERKQFKPHPRNELLWHAALDYYERKSETSCRA
ncbi:helix-turn-helix domain-containing protein [Streptomyces formicae]